MATIVDATSGNKTFSLQGAREMLTAETTADYFSKIDNPEHIHTIVFSTKSFDVPSAKIAAGYIEKMIIND